MFRLYCVNSYNISEIIYRINKQTDSSQKTPKERKRGNIGTYQSGLWTVWKSLFRQGWSKLEGAKRSMPWIIPSYESFDQTTGRIVVLMGLVSSGFWRNADQGLLPSSTNIPSIHTVTDRVGATTTAMATTRTNYLPMGSRADAPVTSRNSPSIKRVWNFTDLKNLRARATSMEGKRISLSFAKETGLPLTVFKGDFHDGLCFYGLC